MGVPIFQEQLMELARVCAGFDGGQSDRLRQAMTHKRSEKAMERLREEVFAGMAAKGVIGAAADEIWEKLQGFAHFGFPESHSVSFAYIVYMSAWLKYHWPAETLAGLLNAQPMGFYSPNSLGPGRPPARGGGTRSLHQPLVSRLHHRRMAGRSRRHPHLLRSELAAGERADRRSACDRRWRFDSGLRYVRNLGEKEIDRIEAARQIGGEFREPRGSGVSHRVVGAMLSKVWLAVGALESLGIERRAGMWAAGALAEIDPERLPLSPGIEAPPLPGMTAEEDPSRRSVGDRGVQHPSDPVHPRRVGCSGMPDRDGSARICAAMG